MVYAYLRVSTEKQFLENQKYEIEQWAKNKKIAIDKFIEEKKSGTITYKERSLGKIIKKLKPDDILILSEISRLGRSLFMVMEILNILIKKKVSLYTVKENFNLSNDISSKVISFAFGLSAEIERNLISQRTKEALAQRKANGIRLGRPIGSHNKHYKLDRYKESIIKLVNENQTLYKISKICNNCGIANIKNYLKYKGIKYDKYHII